MSSKHIDHTAALMKKGQESAEEQTEVTEAFTLWNRAALAAAAKHELDLRTMEDFEQIESGDGRSIQ